MPGHLLPITPLVTALRARLTQYLFPVPVLSLVPQGTAKPYVEIGNILWLEAGTKQDYLKEISTEFNVYDDDQNMVNCNALMQSMLQLLTSEPPDLGEDWNVIDAPSPDGNGEIVKESDEIGIYWRGTFRLRWKIQDMRSAR